MTPKGFSLEDKLAIVTRASKGWFEHIAIASTNAGADVVVAAKDTEVIAKLVDGVCHLRCRALAMPTDVAD